MGEYKKSKITRARVLDASRELFFKDGYTKTRYEDISKLSDVNQGLVYYHFKEKRKLAQIIYTEIITAINELVESKCPDESADMKRCVTTRVKWEAFNKSKNLEAFLCDVAKEGIISNDVATTLFASDSSNFVVDMAACAVDTQFIALFHEHPEMFGSAEAVAEATITMVNKIMDIPADESQKLLEGSKKLAKDIHIEFTDSFKVVK